MALTDPTDTLAYHTSRVFTSHRDMSQIPVSACAAQIKAFLAADTAKSTVPETEALWFYGLNHGMALVQAEFAPLQPLPAGINEFVDYYHATLCPKAVRAFYYLMIICTREFRHCQNLSNMLPKIQAECGTQVAEFFQNAAHGEHGIEKSLLNGNLPAPLGNYVKALQLGFYKGSWSGGFGGKKWGQVTDCLVRFVMGEFSAEMMMDTIWTLSHNNGPIFNKGHCYGMYSNNLVKLLDIQRSGQIPEAILTDKAMEPYIHPDMVEKMMFLDNIFPDKIGKFVDWYQVEALGSVKKYPKEKAAQSAMYGLSPKASEMEALEAKAAKIAAEKEAMSKAEFEANHFEIMPGLVVEKFKPEREAA